MKDSGNSSITTILRFKEDNYHNEASGNRRQQLWGCIKGSRHA
jgi:hypothetical protein